MAKEHMTALSTKTAFRRTGLRHVHSKKDNTSNADTGSIKRRRNVETPEMVPCTDDVREYRKEIAFDNILRSIRQSFLKIPNFLWNFYIEALLIPAYREEWRKFKRWDPQAHVMTKKELNTRGILTTMQAAPECEFRNRESFEMILYFYQSGGRIRRPYSVDTAVFYAELVFFDLGETFLNEFRESEGYYAEEDEAKLLPKNMFQRKIWLLLEYPESSTLATAVAFNSVFTIVLSIAAFCIGTIPEFGLKKSTSDQIPELGKESNPDEENATDFQDVLNVIETVCVLWFCLEFVTRFISSPKKFRFCTDMMNIIDFVAIVPYFIQLLTALSPSNMSGTESINRATYLSVLRVIRLVRVFRIFKLSRHSKGLQILGLTLKASLQELGLLIFFLFIGVVLFSSAIYFAEQEAKKDSLFPSIPSAFYWGVVTMTTVGYGDMVPRTALGKVIGTVTCVAGVLTIALPVPVIVSNFNFFYSRATEKRGMDANVCNQEHAKMCPFLPGNGIHPDAPEGYDGTLPEGSAYNITVPGSSVSVKGSQKSKSVK
ncbi:unnamed protein product [Allacma fusca]|uniref:Uncharacterized protein n=1 Tax=Allacma fusca TaxID=39272 RepID=A0A8J2KSL6_9HEXA|nr:unnamed protein product [Allacma fusca]